MKKDFQKECLKAQSELEMLYEIGNSMHTTLNLEEILYIILTAVTSHIGLSFNRAMLFLVNEKGDRLEGKMGIGPDSGEDANAIWSHIERHKMGLDELIGAGAGFEHLKKSRLHKTIKSMKIPVADDSGIIALTVMEGMPSITVNAMIPESSATGIFIDFMVLWSLDFFRCSNPAPAPMSSSRPILCLSI